MLRRLMKISGLCVFLFVGLAPTNDSDALGLHPSDVVADQLAEYKKVLLNYFKPFNLLPIILPAGQKPGYVFDIGQGGVLRATAEECFPGLVQPASVQSALAYTFELGHWDCPLWRRSVSMGISSPRSG